MRQSNPDKARFRHLYYYFGFSDILPGMNSEASKAADPEIVRSTGPASNRGLTGPPAKVDVPTLLLCLCGKHCQSHVLDVDGSIDITVVGRTAAFTGPLPDFQIFGFFGKRTAHMAHL